MTPRWTGNATLTSVQPDSYEDATVQRTYSLTSYWRLEPVRVKVRLELLRWVDGSSQQFRVDDFESDSGVMTDEFPLAFLDSCAGLSPVAPLELSLLLADLHSRILTHQRACEEVLNGLDFARPSQENKDRLNAFAMGCYW